MNNRFYELDSMRGLAAIAVILFHYSTKYDELFGHSKENYLFDFKYGYFGVHSFFIISGFVIYMTIIKSISTKDFVIKRIIRLYPAYITAVIVTYITVTLYQYDNVRVNLLEAILNLTMLQGFTPFIRSVDGAYWSLTIEISFYVIIVFLFHLKLARKMVMASIVWLIIGALFQIIEVNKYFNYLLLKNLFKKIPFSMHIARSTAMRR